MARSEALSFVTTGLDPVVRAEVRFTSPTVDLIEPLGRMDCRIKSGNDHNRHPEVAA
jgi:hypothetical protein